METIAGFPFFKLDFTKEGAVDASDHSTVAAALADPGITELLILSHGWNNDIAEARALYEELLGNLRSTIDREGEAARSIAVVGVYWPSKRFTDDALRPSADPGGGSASITGVGDVRLLADKLDRLGELLGGIDPAILDRAKAALPDLEDRAKARTDFVEALQAMLPQPSDTEDDNSARLFTPHEGDDILNALSDPVELADDRVSGGGVTALLDEGRAMDADGSASSLANFWNGAKGGAWRLLNYSTYYVMKERAGAIGAGLNKVLAGIRAGRPDLHIHLAGHSFGARVVTAAVAGGIPFRPQSLALLQGAFSHNGFAANIDGKAGFFRSVIVENRVLGPIIVTHTRNDKAVGIAYAIASRFSGDKRAAVGGPADKFGGIGRNGAMRMQQEATASKLEQGSFVYPPWTPTRITNLLADEFIADHGDVAGPEVANALFAAMRLPG
ncbi:MAG: hypothetical protein AABZ76_22555 [Pseudomonadota bacterium]|uniref:hypothetical protein n=1 Tax=Sphingobium yanoikuyae TaxID=13690 RepID=UPI001378A8FF|nr:hypothetical protein [Sphingobium yanoikuyae]NBB42265.1 hypothetical protein [Sphingobium yanoikuyae]